MRLICSLILGAIASISALAQSGAATTAVQPDNSAPRLDAVHRVDPGQMYYRIYARVHLMGSGKKGDEIRPMFTPTPDTAPKNHSGVLAWQMQLSDDGKWALVELVGATAKDLQSIISALPPGQVFERGKHTQAEIEAEFQKYKKNFTLNSFGVRAQ